jgi:hypothetical protein
LTARAVRPILAYGTSLPALSLSVSTQCQGEDDMRRLLAGIIAAALTAMPGAARAQSYFVHCANGKIEVDSRNLQQMKTARGSSVCQLGGFNYLSDAQSFAQKNFGGAGKTCSCK